MAAASEGTCAFVAMGAAGCGKSTVGKLLAEALGCPFYDADDYHSEENKEKMRNGIPLTDEDRFPWLNTLSSLLARHVAAGEPAVLACSALKPHYRQMLRSAVNAEEGSMSALTTSRDPNTVAGVTANPKNLKNPESLTNTNNKKNSEHFEGHSGEEEARSESKQAMGMSEPNSKPHRGMMFIHLSGSLELFSARVSARHKEGSHYMPPSLIKSQMEALLVEPHEEDVVSVNAGKGPRGIVEDVLHMLGQRSGSSVQGNLNGTVA